MKFLANITATVIAAMLALFVIAIAVALGLGLVYIILSLWRALFA